MIQAQVMKYVATTVGPWLLKLLWPLIERFVADLAKDIFEKLKDRSKEAVQNHLETRQREAMQKASSAEQSAKEATNPQEKEELEFSATMWREMAQKLQADNDALKAQLNNLVLVAEQEFDSKIKNGHTITLGKRFRRIRNP
jgi:hypothetical protein